MQEKVLIIGAGMAGLTAARELQRAGISVTLIDKGRGVGGRMATRRMNSPRGEGRVDHGAQFFTTRSKAFKLLVEEWTEQGHAAEWCKGFDDQDGHSRFRGQASMNAIAKHLADGLEIHRQQRVKRIQPGEGWTLEAESGDQFEGTCLLLTAPVPQALDLLRDNRISYPDALNQVIYDPCLAVLATLDAPSGLPHPGVQRFTTGPVEWMADNQVKGISETPTLTLHAEPGFSARHFDGDREAAAAEMMRAINPWVQAEVIDYQVHGWRYSKPRALYDEKSICVQETPPLYMAGDGFGAPRIEGAFLSGLHAAERIARQLR